MAVLRKSAFLGAKSLFLAMYGELGVGNGATWPGWPGMEAGDMGGGKEKVGLG